jgi:hypothetical protein
VGYDMSKVRIVVDLALGRQPRESLNTPLMSLRGALIAFVLTVVVLAIVVIATA